MVNFLKFIILLYNVEMWIRVEGRVITIGKCLCGSNGHVPKLFR